MGLISALQLGWQGLPEGSGGCGIPPPKRGEGAPSWKDFAKPANQTTF